MFEFSILIGGIIFTSYILGQHNAKKTDAEQVIELVINRLCHDGYIHYEKMDDGDYNLIKIKDIDNGIAKT
jgi:hypothetical protein